MIVARGAASDFSAVKGSSICSFIFVLAPDPCPFPFVTILLLFHKKIKWGTTKRPLENLHAKCHDKTQNVGAEPFYTYLRLEHTHLHLTCLIQHLQNELEVSVDSYRKVTGNSTLTWHGSSY